MSVLQRLHRGLRLPRLGPAFNRLWVRLINRRRRRYRELDYITLTLPATMPALPEPRGWLMRRIQGPPTLSLWALDRLFERIADDPRPTGIILNLTGLAMTLADLQTLRQSILRLRGRGKRVIAYAQTYGLGPYYIASACDAILLQPGGELATLGLRDEATFLKDALDAIGVSLDVVAISPFKGAYDQFSRREMSPEARAQADWLLDSRYEMLLEDIAAGRGWTRETARRLIDAAPHLDSDALAAGYVDGVLNEEGLPAWLETKQLVPWAQARKWLFMKAQPAYDRHIALLNISGLMMQGESARPPIDLPVPFIGGARAGDRTVVGRVRRLMKQENVAAVVLFIDSPGGVALAVEAMTSALDELAKSRPLVVYMNAVAASGGYYVATPARWIVAQPGTITGSIGVVSAKPVTDGLFDRLRVHSVELSRGANATLYSSREPFTNAQRAQVRAGIERIYQLFISRVARSRGLSEQAVDEVGGGRVWTGAQARTHGLVDELGDLRAAWVKACQLAGLPEDTPLIMADAKSGALPPQLAETPVPSAALAYLRDNALAIASGTPQTLLPVWWGSKVQ